MQEHVQHNLSVSHITTLVSQLLITYVSVTACSNDNVLLQYAGVTTVQRACTKCYKESSFLKIF